MYAKVEHLKVQKEINMSNLQIRAGVMASLASILPAFPISHKGTGESWLLHFNTWMLQVFGFLPLMCKSWQELLAPGLSQASLAIVVICEWNHSMENSVSLPLSPCNTTFHINKN